MLLIIGIVLFIMHRISVFYDNKYRNMNDYSLVAKFVHNYSSSWNSMCLCFFCGSVTCVWFYLSKFWISIPVASLSLLVVALNLGCLMVMIIGNTLRIILTGDLWQVKSLINDFREYLRELRRDLKKYLVDVVCSYTIKSLSATLVVVTIYNMLITIIKNH